MQKTGWTKPGMERLFIMCLTFKQSRRTSGEINKQLKHGLQDPPAPRSQITFIPFYSKVPPS